MSAGIEIGGGTGIDGARTDKAGVIVDELRKSKISSILRVEGFKTDDIEAVLAVGKLATRDDEVPEDVEGAVDDPLIMLIKGTGD